MTAKEFVGYYEYLTPVLKSLIFHYEESVNAETFAQFIEDIEVLLNESRKFLAEANPGASRAHVLHALIEREVQKAESIPTSCKKGCSACCHLEVEITPDEASLLADIIERGHPVDLERLEHQSQKKRQDASWLLGVTAMNRCVFLGDQGACSIYEDRPSICRKHSVVSPAEHCMAANQAPVVRNVPLAEIVLSSAIDIAEGRVGSISSMVIKELRERRLAQSQLLSLASE